MMREKIKFLLLALWPGLAAAEGEPAGEFDYYVLSLSWSPTWCALEGNARQSPQCDESRDLGWTLHGLWPQYHRGWPSFCRTSYSAPSRGQTGEMADIMGTSGLAWHQWRKHGVCTGLSPEDYYALSRAAYARINRPDVLRRLDEPVRLPAGLIEEAFLRDNPDLFADAITITCRSGRIQEARICMARDDLEFVPCGADVIRDCTLDDALLDPIP